MTTEYIVRMSAFCGMTYDLDSFECLQDARKRAADRIRWLRSEERDHSVSTLKKGLEWECTEPEDCAMIPDTAGILCIVTVSHNCPDCDDEFNEEG